jgi:25S rRNA (adenine2142-N1)-methyltransferase
MELSPPEQEGRYDILCLSLVLNFVPSPELRGKMLKRINLFLRQSSGRLFIVLPLACVCNSRYMTDNHFRAIMTKLGYQLVENHFSNKLAYYLFQLVELSDANIQPMFEKKRILVEGANRNNFAIIL